MSKRSTNLLAGCLMVGAVGIAIAQEQTKSQQSGQASGKATASGSATATASAGGSTTASGATAASGQTLGSARDSRLNVYIVVYEDQNLKDRQLNHEHYMAELAVKGVSLLQGPFRDQTGETMIFQAKDDVTAKQIVAQDSDVQNGSMKVVLLKPWTVVHDRWSGPGIVTVPRPGGG